MAGPPYEFGVDNSDATVATLFMVFGSYIILIALLAYPALFKLSHRFPRDTSASNGLLFKLEAAFGQYIVVASLFAASTLCQAILSTEYPAESDDGYEVFGRLMRFLFFVGGGALTDTAMRPNIVGAVSNLKLLHMIFRIIGSASLIVGLVTLVVEPDEDGVLIGVCMIVLAIPSLITAALALKNEKGIAEPHITTGRFFIACSMCMYILIGIWRASWDGVCSKLGAREADQCSSCPFEDDLNHNFWANVFTLIHIVLLGPALLRTGTITMNSSVRRFEPNLSPVVETTLDKPISERRQVYPEPDIQPAPEPKPEPEPPLEVVRKTETAPEPKPPPETKPDPKHQLEAKPRENVSEPDSVPALALDIDSDSQPTTSSESGPTPKNDLPESRISETEDEEVKGHNQIMKTPEQVTIKKKDSKSKSKIVPKGNVVEDSVLKKMYDLFTKSDNGCVDIADAGMTKEEFEASITVEKLQEILKPIGGLDLSRVDPSLTMAAGVEIPPSLIFQTLDRDGNSRITATEFIKLLREKASTTYTSVVEDEVLAKLYKLFSNADNGEIDAADAGLTDWEFNANITISDLQKTLAPIGGLDLRRLDTSITESRNIDIDDVFKALDKDGNDRVTASEFVKLIRIKRSWS